MRDPYLYPGTTVLINHFNIQDQERLTSKEHRETLKTLQSLHDDPVQGDFDFAHLREIHRRIFEPMYPFAGETRTIDLIKAEEKLEGASVDYTPFHLIRIVADHHLNDLSAADWSGLKDMSRPEDMRDFRHAHDRNMEGAPVSGGQHPHHDDLHAPVRASQWLCLGSGSYS